MKSSPQHSTQGPQARHCFWSTNDFGMIPLGEAKEIATKARHRMTFMVTHLDCKLMKGRFQHLQRFRHDENDSGFHFGDQSAC
ncbi:hypothetical protein NQ315_006227 [Exocentrus adspersus]|uniref:Uncharacterized protein n=1 Tax=Exocentrus adspersus TaxID=1586481 RepID=A0AAV8VZM5_9CUCU|nr:hypothetical protein NQ315_006227 [Exocentrus adspersus]